MQVPKVYRGKSLIGLKGVSDTKRQCVETIVNGKSLILSGPCGTGKTHMAVALLKSRGFFLMNADAPPKKTPLFVSVTDLMEKLRDSFGRDGVNEADIIDDIVSRPLLLLDDLGAMKLTEYARDALYRIIDRRYRGELQTIVTTNLSIKEISEEIDDRLASRLCEMGPVVSLGTKDYRIYP